MENLNDASPMPYGIHKDKQMADVPADYLVWLYDNKRCNGAVWKYVDDRIADLRMEIANLAKGIR